MTLSLQLWVEGATDASLRQAAGQSEQGGALPQLVRRTLLELYEGSPNTFDRLLVDQVGVEWLKERLRSVIALPRGRGHKNLSGWAKKLLVAFQQVRHASPDSLVVAIRDCDGDNDRLKQQAEVNCELASQCLT
jgi:hypothetical protein